MNKKLKLSIFIFILGFIGVLSTLLMDIPVPENMREMIEESFTPCQFKFLSLINPTILLLFTVVLGTVFYDKVHFKLPIIESLLFGQKAEDNKSIMQYGVIGGIISGILIIAVAAIFYPYLPEEFIAIGKNFKSHIVTRFLYGGITEEILMRFGLMSFVVWVISQITNNLKSSAYWIGIILAAILFGIGHLPIVFAFVGTPTTELIIYIMLGNTIGGIVFGWLYWKKGLEAAMIGHMFAHITMILGEQIFNL